MPGSSILLSSATVRGKLLFSDPKQLCSISYFIFTLNIHISPRMHFPKASNSMALFDCKFKKGLLTFNSSEDGTCPSTGLLRKLNINTIRGLLCLSRIEVIKLGGV